MSFIHVYVGMIMSVYITQIHILQYIFQGCDRDYILLFTFKINRCIEDFFFFFYRKSEEKNNRKHPTNPLHTAFAYVYTSITSLRAMPLLIRKGHKE